MIDGPDLFGNLPPPTYPDVPGHRGRETSIEAAENIASRASVIRERVYAFLQNNGPHAEFEITAASGFPRWTVQPRVSELRKAGRIIATGERRINPETGASADVLRVA